MAVLKLSGSLAVAEGQVAVREGWSFVICQWKNAPEDLRRSECSELSKSGCGS